MANIKIKIEMVAEIDSSVFPSNDLPAAKQNLYSLLREGLWSLQEQKIECVANSSMFTKEEKDFALMQIDESIRLYNKLLTSIKIQIQ